MAYIYNLGLLFQQVVNTCHNRIALSYSDGKTFSYQEINQFSNQIAHFLLDLGIKKGQVIALFNDKSALALASMLACLKLGIIYTNLDPNNPWERLQRIIETCQPSLIINAFPNLPHENYLKNEHICKIVNLQQVLSPEKLNQFSSNNIPEITKVTGTNPAYLMFTSGSTGFPKGVVISHANVLNFIEWAKERFDITCEDIFSNVNPIYFDNSVFDFYISLFSGAMMIPFSTEEIKDSRNTIKIINEKKCTIWFSVPSLLVYLLTTRVLTKDDFPNVRKIIFGGEGFPKPKLKQLYDLFGHHTDLENVYGPTECTCICSAYTINEQDLTDLSQIAPLGYLAPNFDYDIIPLNPDNPNYGELLLLGANVGLGYFNDAERTKKSFIQNPNHNNYRDIGYKTGDLVNRDAEGLLYFKGRADFQIKHLGYRIELEEIEAALNILSFVNESAVIYHKLGEGLGEIIAFVSVKETTTSEEIMESVKKILPNYMTPKKIKILDILPKNQNGKIDRQTLLNSTTIN